MNAEGLNFVLPKHFGDYRPVWIFSFGLAIIFAPLVVVLNNSAPWLIAVPIVIGAVAIFIYELWASSQWESDEPGYFVGFPQDLKGLKAYEQFFALEINPPRRKDGKGQLALFAGFTETTSSNSIRFVDSTDGRRIAIIPCDRYSALLITYLLENLDKATEKSLAAGMSRFGKLGKGQSDIKLFVQDKGIREIIKADFRGNLLSLVTKGGEKVVKDLLKTAELRSELEKQSEITHP
jgi:hypothetical protein